MRLMRLSRGNLYDWLVNRGWQQIGRGSFSVVLASPAIPDKVLKLGQGDNWPDYVKWGTKRGWAGTLTPKVYSLKYHIDPHTYSGKWYSAWVERFEGVCEDYDWIDRDKRASFDVMEKYHAMYNAIIPFHQGRPTDFVIPETWKTFAKAIATKGWTSDLKGANWLWRKDGSICLNDPACDNPYWTGRVRDGVFDKPRQISDKAKPLLNSIADFWPKAKQEENVL